MTTLKPAFVNLIPLSKSIKNDTYYINYRNPMTLLLKNSTYREHVINQKAVIMDQRVFEKNETPMAKCHVIIVLNSTQSGSGWSADKFIKKKKDIYRDCHIQCVEEKALAVMIQSFKNKYGTIYIMGTQHLFTYMTQINKFSIDTLFIQLYERTGYATLEEYEKEKKEWGESLDVFSPPDFLKSYALDAFTKEKNNTLLCYRKSQMEEINSHEKEYLNLLTDILTNGKERPDRTGVGTVGLFGRQLRFDLTSSIPLLTTKKMAWKSVVKELLWFLSGDTNSKTLEKQNVNIWKGNTSRDFLDKRRLYKYAEGDVGPLYPFSFRHYGADYEGAGKDYSQKGYDQWSHLLHGLRHDPFSRRHLMTTFNPAVVPQCVLPPCHGIAIQFYVERPEANDPYDLKCHVYCRSSDTFLGLPFNIASYAILTYIVAKLCDMKPCELIISTGDTHIYKNHIDQVKEQLKRTALPPPKLMVKDTIKDKDITEVSLSDFELIGYFSHPPIKADMAI